jgi:hypothetical protein
MAAVGVLPQQGGDSFDRVLLRFFPAGIGFRDDRALALLIFQSALQRPLGIHPSWDARQYARRTRQPAMVISLTSSLRRVLSLSSIMVSSATSPVEEEQKVPFAGLPLPG